MVGFLIYCVLREVQNFHPYYQKLLELLSTFLGAYQIISIFTRVFMQIIRAICNAMNENSFP